MVMIPVPSGKTNQSDDVALNVQTKPDSIFNPGQGMMKINKKEKPFTHFESLFYITPIILL